MKIRVVTTVQKGHISGRTPLSLVTKSTYEQLLTVLNNCFPARNIDEEVSIIQLIGKNIISK